jgi:hypothetical protein
MGGCSCLPRSCLTKHHYRVLPSFREVVSIIGGFHTLLKFSLNLQDIHTHMVVKFLLVMLVVDKGFCFITPTEGVIVKTCPYRLVANLFSIDLYMAYEPDLRVFFVKDRIIGLYNNNQCVHPSPQ